jgi:hypothetical protein
LLFAIFFCPLQNEKAYFGICLVFFATKEANLHENLKLQKHLVR